VVNVLTLRMFRRIIRAIGNGTQAGGSAAAK
jgi:hypothetical protein